MNETLAYLFCVGLSTMQPLEQDFKTYQSQFKKIPLLSSLTQTAHTTNSSEHHILFKQKLGFRKKRIEYTLAVGY